MQISAEKPLFYETRKVLKTFRVFQIGLLMLIFTVATLPASSGRAEWLGEERKETLCGRLTFLQNTKTGENLIGLIPCGQSQPIIFSYRPSELHDYYRLHEVVIKQGTPVYTANFGKISSYITKFSASFGIQDCNDCKIRAATWTPLPAAGIAELRGVDHRDDGGADGEPGAGDERQRPDPLRDGGVRGPRRSCASNARETRTAGHGRWRFTWAGSWARSCRRTRSRPRR